MYFFEYFICNIVPLHNVSGFKLHINIIGVPTFTSILYGEAHVDSGNSKIQQEQENVWLYIGLLQNLL